MTAQVAENLIYLGKRYDMCTCPPLSADDLRPRFRSFITCNWRGYVGTWEIDEDRLYLCAVHGQLEAGTSGSIQTFHPDSDGRVFAHWFSGELRLPMGRLVHSVHMGFESTWSVELFLIVQDGVVVGQRTEHHTASEFPKKRVDLLEIPAFLRRSD